jgi:hypothetical protein
MVPMVLALGVRPLLRASKGPSALYGHRAETHWRVQIARPIGEGRASGQAGAAGPARQQGMGDEEALRLGGVTVERGPLFLSLEAGPPHGR